MPDTIPISKFKATCLRVIDQVKNTGIPVIITKRGEPYALVTSPPEPEKQKNWLGKYKNKIEISGDIMEPASCQSEWDVLQ